MGDTRSPPSALAFHRFDNPRFDLSLVDVFENIEAVLIL
jgi:hypothetical protein